MTFHHIPTHLIKGEHLHRSQLAVRCLFGLWPWRTAVHIVCYHVNKWVNHVSEIECSGYQPEQLHVSTDKTCAVVYLASSRLGFWSISASKSLQTNILHCSASFLSQRGPQFCVFLADSCDSTPTSFTSSSVCVVQHWRWWVCCLQIKLYQSGVTDISQKRETSSSQILPFIFQQPIFLLPKTAASLGNILFVSSAQWHHVVSRMTSQTEIWNCSWKRLKSVKWTINSNKVSHRCKIDLALCI